MNICRIHMDNGCIIYPVKDIIFDKGIIESTCYYTSYLINTRIGAGTVENIVVNVDILSPLLWISSSITYHPDSGTISVVDYIIIYFYIADGTSCRLLDRIPGPPALQ